MKCTTSKFANQIASYAFAYIALFAKHALPVLIIIAIFFSNVSALWAIVTGYIIPFIIVGIIIIMCGRIPKENDDIIITLYIIVETCCKSVTIVYMLYKFMS